ncbi:carbohydrate ABC transporter permease [Desulfotomaculum copahuensis]|uniref:ABC transporter permease n=1 Tax=Desulfotomaculum copahuensis TaxID=1838280 RepID=A0A1B7LFH1_9FIRM|nr:sugar ABC transporter permease [Desulfotomaculum copahuensis]OAT82313.1 ABC transporter permease [Desulfotomaculum copahuensis]
MRRFIPLVFIAPALFLIVLFTFWPVLSTLHLSFLQWNMISPRARWEGPGNYLSLLTGREFWLAGYNTLVYTVILLVFNLVLPYLVAYAVTRVPPRRQTPYKALIFAPGVISLAVASVIFLWLYNPVLGPVDILLRHLGLGAPAWLTGYRTVIWALSLITTWKLFGYNFIVLLAGLVAVPRELIQAAQLEGASGWQIFWHIIRPQTSATSLYVLVMTVVWGAQYVFVPIQMLTNGGPDYASTNLVFLIYQYGFGFFQAGKAAACAVLTLLVFLVLILLQARVLEKKVYYED